MIWGGGGKEGGERDEVFVRGGGEGEQFTSLKVALPPAPTP